MWLRIPTIIPLHFEWLLIISFMYACSYIFVFLKSLVTIRLSLVGEVQAYYNIYFFMQSIYFIPKITPSTIIKPRSPSNP